MEKQADQLFYNVFVKPKNISGQGLMSRSACPKIGFIFVNS